MAHEEIQHVYETKAGEDKTIINPTELLDSNQTHILK